MYPKMQTTTLIHLVTRLAAGVAVTGILAATPVAAQEAPDLETCPWMDTSLAADERAQLLLDASSLEQKMRWLNEWAANRPTETIFDEVIYPEQVPCTPDVLYANGPEGLHGTEGTTAWPSPIALAATFNPELVEQKGAATAVEAFAHGVSVILGPGIVSGRTPLSGRNPEYFGEDPLLSGRMAAATVRGLEDAHPEMAIISNLKHYVANEQELDRELSSSNIDERTLQQVYDLPYRIAIEEGDPGSIMCAYNLINNIYACENEILNTNLKDRAGFTGYVMSDFGSVHSTAPSLKAGLDQELNRPVWFTPGKLNAALDAGEISEDDIEQAAFRVVHSYIAHGLFDNERPEGEPEEPASTPQHKDLALELTEQGMVLLKNDGALPLNTKDAGTIALVGPTASLVEIDGVSARTACAAYLVFISGPVLNCDSMVDPLTAFARRANESGANVIFADGSDIDAVTQAAEAADTVFVFGHLTMGETSDAKDLLLDGNGNDLVEAAAAANESTVAVVASGTAVEMPWIDDVAGVIHTWYSGEMMGPALANLAFGDANFSGRLPMSLPVSLDQSPIQTEEQYPGVFEDGSTVRAEDDEESIREVDYSEGLSTGYKWYQDNEAPLFAFGHGLSYSEFVYSDLSVSMSESGDGLETQVSFTVENISGVDGTAVPQVYLEFPESAEEPGMRLVAFDRIALSAEESQTVTLSFASDSGARPYQVWDEQADEWTVVEGNYTVALGKSAQDIILEQSQSIPR